MDGFKIIFGRDVSFINSYRSTIIGKVSAAATGNWGQSEKLNSSNCQRKIFKYMKSYWKAFILLHDIEF